MDATNESQVLKRLDFPAYCIRMLENGLVALSGGGGTAKTGVANAIELGLVDYDDLTDYSGRPAAVATASPSARVLERLLAKKSPVRAHFETVHSYQPNDAIMKFISFAIDRPCSSCKKTAGDGHNHSAAKKTEATPGPVRRNVYVIAAVNNWLEFYEVQSTVQKSTDNLDAGHGQDGGKVRQRKASAAKKKSSSSRLDNNNNKGHSNGSVHSASSDHDNTAATALQASSQLNLILKIDTVANKSMEYLGAKADNETFLPEPAPSEATETVNAMAISKASRDAKAADKASSSIQLCVGTSKGAIMIWHLVFKYDEHGRLLAIHRDRCHVNSSAHAGKEVDDVQVNESLLEPNAGISHLLSIGRDNKCCIWSLSASFQKLAEIDYAASLANTNLRMRHARYDALGRNFFATYIPRSRGGGSADTSSFLQRWAALKFKKPPGYQVGKERAKDLVEFELNGTVFNYKLMATRRIRNTIVTAMQCARDGSQVCVGDYEGRVYLYDIDLNVLRQFKRQHTSVVTDLAFYYDSVRPYEASKLILSLSIDRTLQCYKNLANGQPAKTAANQAALLKAEAFSDAKKAAAVSSSSIARPSLLGVMLPKLFCLLGLLFLVVFYFFGHFE